LTIEVPTFAKPPRTGVGIFEMILLPIPPMPGTIENADDARFLTIEKKPGSPL